MMSWQANLMLLPAPRTRAPLADLALGDTLLIA